MSKNHWCTSKTWSLKDRERFYERNARSRGDDSKAQYMRVQANSLFETNKTKLVKAALELLEESFSEYPDASARALSFELAGKCCVFLNKNQKAIEYFLSALERQKEYIGIQTNACYALGTLVVEEDVDGLFETVEVALNDFGAPVFAYHAYKEYGIRAYIARYQGKYQEAKLLAKKSIKASKIKDSGLGWGRNKVGLVLKKRTKFHRKIKALENA